MECVVCVSVILRALPAVVVVVKPSFTTLRNTQERTLIAWGTEREKKLGGGGGCYPFLSPLGTPRKDLSVLYIYATTANPKSTCNCSSHKILYFIWTKNKKNKHYKKIFHVFFFLLLKAFWDSLSRWSHRCVFTVFVLFFVCFLHFFLLLIARRSPNCVDRSLSPKNFCMLMKQRQHTHTVHGF